ncbi:hypothetical protein L5515_006499 [Caenorhabditis briggsae]|uniref:Uncharacterized protein n=1 Tax=Caenorhabditis briggsae TaxID=6238 RepID=A0AAE9F4M8_CAEBR|nr:hypothetical protein L5515_006499 [Caenorhabditis briggsae]
MTNKMSIVSCKICGQDSHGIHFGVRSCRACAAFFRRYAHSKWVIAKCTRKSANREVCFCRPCRLQKCLRLGMVTTKFQYGREIFSLASKTPTKLNPTLASFIGRPEFLMFCDPQPSNSKTFIDVQNLLSEASRLLNMGCETPILAENQLKKLSLGAKFLKLDVENVKFLGRFGKDEFVDVIEFYFVSVIKWISRFDEFQKLERDLQMTLLNSIWHVFMRFHKCSATALFRKSNHNALPSQKILRNVCMDRMKSCLDTTWMSDFPREYVGIYMKSQNIYEEDVIEQIEKLSPTDVELTYMFAQTCFQYAGNRFQGEILKITDRFQQILSDDLHVYYIVEQKNSRYFKRLAELMKVNNMIQKSVWESRPQRELNRVFNVLKIGFSHPEMFQDSPFCSFT